MFSMKEVPSFRFKSGDDVPDFILSPDTGGGAFDYLRFGVDVVVFKRPDGYEIHPVHKFEEGEVFIKGKMVNSGDECHLTGGPTKLNYEPVHKEPLPEISTYASVGILLGLTNN